MVPAEGAVVVRSKQAWLIPGGGVRHLGRRQQPAGVPGVDRGKESGPLSSDRGKMQTGAGRRAMQHAESGVEVRPDGLWLPDGSVHPVEGQAGVRVTWWHLHPEQPVQLPAGLIQQGRLESGGCPVPADQLNRGEQLPG